MRTEPGLGLLPLAVLVPFLFRIWIGETGVGREGYICLPNFSASFKRWRALAWRAKGGRSQGIPPPLCQCLWQLQQAAPTFNPHRPALLAPRLPAPPVWGWWWLPAVVNFWDASLSPCGFLVLPSHLESILCFKILLL